MSYMFILLNIFYPQKVNTGITMQKFSISVTLLKVGTISKQRSWLRE